jgi:hypothetical protein
MLLLIKMKLEKIDQTIQIRFSAAEKIFYFFITDFIFPISSIEKIEMERPKLYPPLKPRRFVIGLYGFYRMSAFFIRNWKIQRELWWIDNFKLLNTKNCVTLTLKDEKYRLVILSNNDSLFWQNLEKETTTMH